MRELWPFFVLVILSYIVVSFRVGKTLWGRRNGVPPALAAVFFGVTAEGVCAMLARALGSPWLGVLGRVLLSASIWWFSEHYFGWRRSKSDKGDH